MELITWPDERLRRVADVIDVFDKALREQASKLEAVMRAGPAAVGIAAPQVGWLQRLVIVDVTARKGTNNGLLILLNPEIVQWQGSVIGREGCLSVPEYTGNVVRAAELVIEAQDLYGESCRYEASGFEARVIQHELDHLDGLLFTDRIVSRRSDLFLRQGGA